MEIVSLKCDQTQGLEIQKGSWIIWLDGKCSYKREIKRSVMQIERRHGDYKSGHKSRKGNNCLQKHGVLIT